MQPNARVYSTVVLALLASCNRTAKTASPTPAEAHPLEVYATQRVALAPTARVRAADTSRLVKEHGSTRAMAQWLDGTIALRLRERGIGAQWFLPADLQRSYERNRSYAADPYQLAVEPLRPATFVTGSKYAEPLSSQLRTMIALHEDARLVLVPVELRIEAARAVLRLALLDPRFAEAKWVGEVKSDSLPAGPSGASLAQVALRVADLFVAP